MFDLGRSIRLTSLACSVVLASCVATVRSAERGLSRKAERRGLEHRRDSIAGAQVEFWVEPRDDASSPVVLLHGFGPPGPWQWSHQVDALSKDHRVLMPNLLWFGGSTDPRRDYTLGRQVEVVAALMRSEGMEGAAVLGTSYGGFVAYALSLSHPELVGKLVMMDSPGGVYRQEDYAALLERHRVDDPVELFVPSDADGVERLLALAYADPPAVPDRLADAMLEVVYDRHRAEKAELLSALLGDMGRYDERPSMPSLVIWGDGDTVFPLSLGERLGEAMGADVVVVPKARHAPQMEHPDEVDAALRGWLAER